MGERTYRTFRWGRGVQIWLTESRDFRSANTSTASSKRAVTRACAASLPPSASTSLQGLQHPEPAFRYAAALAIGKRKLPHVEKLVELLSDGNAYVAQAARAGLVELSKKHGPQQDFGPLPGCTCEQVAESAARWREWSQQQCRRPK
jgi:hypothetical protein